MNLQSQIGLLTWQSYYEIVNFFANTSATSHNLLNLRRYVKESCNDTTLLGTFTENHDQPRFANKTDDISLAKNALAYTFMTDGIPIGEFLLLSAQTLSIAHIHPSIRWSGAALLRR